MRIPQELVSLPPNKHAKREQHIDNVILPNISFRFLERQISNTLQSFWTSKTAKPQLPGNATIVPMHVSSGRGVFHK